jgi:hypothetical protein
MAIPFSWAPGRRKDPKRSGRFRDPNTRKPSNHTRAVLTRWVGGHIEGEPVELPGDRREVRRVFVVYGAKPSTWPLSPPTSMGSGPSGSLPDATAPKAVLFKLPEGGGCRCPPTSPPSIPIGPSGLAPQRAVQKVNSLTPGPSIQEATSAGWATPTPSRRSSSVHSVLGRKIAQTSTRTPFSISRFRS